MIRQFMTTCKHCGRRILMTRCEKDGHWIPCSPETIRFLPAGGPETFVDERGNVCRGIRDKTGKLGYKKHYISCAARWKSA